MKNLKANITIHAWKWIRLELPAAVAKVTTMVRCELDDPDAVKFDLIYPGGKGKALTLDSLSKAEEIMSAMHRVFKAGKQAAKAELGDWISY